MIVEVVVAVVVVVVVMDVVVVELAETKENQSDFFPPKSFEPTLNKSHDL